MWLGRAEALAHLRNKWHTANRQNAYLLDLLKRINLEAQPGDFPTVLLHEIERTLELTK